MNKMHLFSQYPILNVQIHVTHLAVPELVVDKTEPCVDVKQVSCPHETETEVFGERASAVINAPSGAFALLATNLDQHKTIIIPRRVIKSRNVLPEFHEILKFPAMTVLKFVVTHENT